MKTKPMMRPRAPRPVLLPPTHNPGLYRYWYKLRTSQQDLPGK